MLPFYGFGTATERIDKLIQDSIFVALMRQHIANFEIHYAGTLSTRLEEDATMMHSLRHYLLAYLSHCGSCGKVEELKFHFLPFLFN
jgi:hypothetical protein